MDGWLMCLVLVTVSSPVIVAAGYLIAATWHRKLHDMSNRGTLLRPVGSQMLELPTMQDSPEELSRKMHALERKMAEDVIRVCGRKKG